MVVLLVSITFKVSITFNVNITLALCLVKLLYLDLYVVNQENTDLIREVHTGDAPFKLHGSRPILLSVA